MSPHYPSDAQAKAQILAAGLKIYQRGLVAANDGNLSVRVGDNALWVTPTGVSKGAMTEDMLVKLDLDGNLLEGTRKPSSETKMHLRIYRENPDVRAVVHAHPPAATAFATAGLPLDRPVLQEAVVQLGEVPVAPFALPGSQAVADSVAPFCRTHRALLLEYHGAVTWGDTMEQAHYRLECLEQMALVTLHLKTLGCDRVMPPSLVKELEGLRPAWGIR
ncbi:MAG: class II aldolase/adducin family protein [Evtepia sp.]|uniref:class II aldolase/adducin family protein n=1 Tax=Evtepia sp. TaxID=2773933 RepID=UPI002A751008|nr:class II aldolase/adducin family protein [Evtepia sp.]MDY3014350.1 class II aldolase/adducin family protein [Evtepia sp.]